MVIGSYLPLELFGAFAATFLSFRQNGQHSPKMPVIASKPVDTGQKIRISQSASAILYHMAQKIQNPQSEIPLHFCPDSTMSGQLKINGLYKRRVFHLNTIAKSYSPNDSWLKTGPWHWTCLAAWQRKFFHFLTVGAVSDA